MMHAICDFCGKDCKRTANLLTISPIQNFPRYHGDTNPTGKATSAISFIMCNDCMTKHALPNPFKDYSLIDKQDIHYEYTLDNQESDNSDTAKNNKEEEDNGLI